MSTEQYSEEFGFPQAVSQATTEVRARFIQKTYLHLAGAILALIGLETVLLNIPGIENFIIPMMNSWMIVIFAFMGVSWIANKWASSNTSLATQSLGLGIYTVAWSIIMLPALYIGHNYYPGVIAQAGIITLALFGALTLIAFTTKKDFSFLGGILMVAGFIAMGTVLAAIIFGFTLGVFFSAAMILLASGYILYDTSNVIHHYREDQHVAASLALFASVALLFYYILNILMSLSSRD